MDSMRWARGIVVVSMMFLAGCQTEASSSPSPSRAALRPSPNWGPISVSPDHGPIGTQVNLHGSGCANSGHAPDLVFINEGVPGLTGTVGGAEVTSVTADAGGHFEAVFVIPPSLHSYQGRGGGAVRPGTYQFLSFPPTCATLFTVTAS
jgi:hypothetical protein